jgi:hypothetical protein
VLQGLLYIAAVICFAVALLVALGVHSLHNWQGWVAGGLLALTLSLGLAPWRAWAGTPGGPPA